MNIDEQHWTVLYNQIKNDYQAKKRFSSQAASQEIVEFLSRVDHLEKALNIMKESPMQYDLSASEIARRQIIMENLRKQIRTLSSNDINGGRMAPLSVAAAANSPITPSSTQTQTTVNNPLNTSNKALLQRQKEVLKQQDMALLDIEKGVDRIHQQAKEIGAELTTQNKILDELDVHVDHATEGLKEETKHAEKIRAQTDACYLYICVVVEIVVLIILLLIAFSPI